MMASRSARSRSASSVFTRQTRLDRHPGWVAHGQGTAAGSCGPPCVPRGLLSSSGIPGRLRWDRCHESCTHARAIPGCGGVGSGASRGYRHDECRHPPLAARLRDERLDASACAWPSGTTPRRNVLAESEWVSYLATTQKRGLLLWCEYGHAFRCAALLSKGDVRAGADPNCESEEDSPCVGVSWP